MGEKSADGMRKLGSWLVEIVVIVASILLAFGIEAWWDERQNREEEQQILAGLEREFTDYQDRLVFALKMHGEMSHAMKTIYQATDQGIWSATDITLDAALMRTLWPPTTELGGGVRDALVQAGGLELISDRTLREKLALWPGVYAEVLDDEVFSREMVFDKLLPHLTSQGFDLGAALEGLRYEGTVPSPINESEAETRRLLTDRKFRSLLQARYGFWLHAGEEYDTALVAAREILELIEKNRRALDG
ncbi:MAG: hypothetical protein AAF552_12430 [Pseudomonadota bacterium]